MAKREKESLRRFEEKMKALRGDLNFQFIFYQIIEVIMKRRYWRNPREPYFPPGMGALTCGLFSRKLIRLIAKDIHKNILPRNRMHSLCLDIITERPGDEGGGGSRVSVITDALYKQL